MESIEKYYDNTFSDKPRKNIQYFVEKIKCIPGNAVELGCGAGNETVYLIKNKWKVHAIDRQDVYLRIAKRLNQEELKLFRFEKNEFKDVELEKNNLVIANFSLPFCEKGEFNKLWNKIENSLLPNRILCRKFFWNK